jgi:NAD(P)-dependent dehydrogenase (short-subunit alcohol dehydrogenase family)
MAVDTGARAPLARTPDLGRWFYTPEWRHSVLPAAAGGAEARRTLVLLGESQLAAQLGEALRAQRREVSVVVAGKELDRATRHLFVLRPEVEHDYDRLLATLADEGGLPQEIVHLWNLAPEPEAASPLERFAEARDRSFLSLAFLARALARRGASDPIAIHVLACGAQQVAGEGLVSPLRAMGFGACRAIPREHPNLRCRSIDLDGTGELPPERLARLLAELHPDAPDEVVAWRGHARLVPTFARLPLAAPPRDRIRLRDRGAYLVTGGLGGLGFALAEHLARHARARLMLVGRHGLPSRDGWSIWLDGHRESDPTSQRIRRVQALEALGAEVVVAGADVAEAATMREVVALARSHFGPLHGVFHAAAARGAGPLARRSPEQLGAALAPKVLGTLALEEALGDAPLDFLVLYSALAGGSGADEDADAAAACAFLDAWALHRAADGGRITLSIGWSTWQEVGAAAERARELGHAAGAAGGEAGHPLLGRFLGEQDGEERYGAQLSAESAWLLAEHRVEGGAHVLPASAWLEVARALLGRDPAEHGIEVRDLVALRPFAVREGESRELRVRFRRASGDLVVESGPAAGRVEHARGRAVRATEGVPDRYSLAGIRGRCNLRRLEGASLPSAPRLRVGLRWACVRGIDVGPDEVLAELALPAAFRGDLDAFALHPALVDAAIGAARALLPGSTTPDALYVPISYGRVRVYDALPPRFFCRVRWRRFESPGAAGRFAVFDATLLDEGGRELASFDEIVWGPLGEVAPLGAPEPAPAAEAPRGAEPPAPSLLAHLEGAIRPAEGLEALERLLAFDTPAHVLVSPFELEPWLARLAAHGDAHGPAVARTQRAAGGGAHATAPAVPPAGASDEDEPRTDLERALAALWCETLGVARAGRHDRFFERGGTPALALRLLAAVEERSGVRLGHASLVLQTLEQLAAEIERRHAPPEPTPGAAGAAAAPPPRPRRWLEAVLRRVS